MKFYKNLIFISLFIYALNVFDKPIIYYCPSPEDFINLNNKIIAKTKYHQFEYSWLVQDITQSQFLEYPLTFKGENLVNC
ncbi:hypothetical protein NAI67_11160, partial [Francisella tularensis subsp. holarctica]|nr:hypothetical protein [Francisella tularensis subsp. holarctica]